MKQGLKTLFTIIIVLSSFYSLAQPPCSNDTEPPGNDACNATPICDFDGYCGRTLPDYSPVTAWTELANAIKQHSSVGWDQIDLDNDSYLKFIASSSDITFNVYVYDCVNGLGWNSSGAIQIAFFHAESCSGGPVEVVYTALEMKDDVPFHTVNITGLIPGETYFILIDGYSGKNCGYTFEAVDGVAAPGVAIDIAPEITVCTGEEVEANATGGEGDYSWNGPSGLSTTTGSSVNITAPNTPGEYSYSVESTGGNDFCPNNSSDELVLIVENCDDCDSPNLTVQSLSSCTATTFDLNDAIDPSSDQANISFYNSQADATNGTNEINSTVSSSGSYWVRAENETDDDCFNIYEIVVNISNLDYDATTTDATCGDNNGAIVLNPTGGEAPYIYSIDNGNSSQNNGEFNNLTAGSYNILIIDNNGCETTGTAIVANSGAPAISAPSDLDICLGESVTLTADNPGNATISWDNGINDGVSFTPTTTGSTTYTVTANANGCDGYDNVIVTVHDIPSPDFEADQIIGCSPLLVHFTDNNHENGDNCFWEFGDQGSSTECEDVTFLFDEEGDFTVTLSVTSQYGCEGTTTIADYIHVDEGPIAGFSANPQTVFIPETEVSFTNESSGENGYTWDFGDNSSITNLNEEGNPFHIFPTDEPGQYNVTLTVTNGDCESEISKTITVKAPGVEYEIPNVFTPNGDGDNDYFQFVYANNIKNINVLIVNRWNNQVFESDQVDFKWNGKVNNSGPNCHEGVYFYILKIESLDGTEFQENGYLHLVTGKK